MGTDLLTHLCGNCYKNFYYTMDNVRKEEGKIIVTCPFCGQEHVYVNKKGMYYEAEN